MISYGHAVVAPSTVTHPNGAEVYSVIVAVRDAWNFPGHNYGGLFFMGASHEVLWRGSQSLRMKLVFLVARSH